jgi:hypothetical protein
MGRFSSVLLVLLAACGDNPSSDGVDPVPVDGIEPSGNAIEAARYVPSVCSVRSWTAGGGGDVALDVSVAPRPDGAAVLATPRTGGTLTGFLLDTRMNMTATAKLPIDGTFTQVVGSYVHDRVVSTAVQSGAVFVHLLDADLRNAQYTAKLPGLRLADPAFYQAQADLVMPIGADDGLWLHRFSDSFVPQGSTRLFATKPAIALAAAQMGVATLVAMSTQSECYMMVTSTFAPGPSAYVPAACPQPHLAVDQKTAEGIMVFESPEGVRLMHVYQTQFGGDAPLVRAGASAPRALFDGSRFWVSYLDERGDVIVGFLDESRKLVSMSLAGPRPSALAYELVLVDGSPWVFSLGSDGYSAYRMCVDTLDE